VKLAEVREFYYVYSGKLSDVCRQLGFAGIALVWIFGLGTNVNARLPHNLILPSLLIVTSLALDFLHYVASTVLWGVFARIKERDDNTSADTDFEAPARINWAPLAFFWGKVAALGAAYVALGSYLAGRLL
jgi:hypothetical protein